MNQGGDVDYDRTGAGYGLQRRADPRIGAFIASALGDARSVLNVGAGAGSYEPMDRNVLAVEPSAVMRAQRSRLAGPAIHAFAGDLPLDDNSIDAVMAVFTVHQWPDLARGLAEMRRVARGPVVVLAADGDRLPAFWVNAYAPELIDAERRRYPPIEAIAAGIGDRAEVTAIPIPFDCSDGIVEAFYGRPERLLDPAVRAAQSSWGFAPAGTEARFHEHLAADLASGLWDERYGELRRQSTYEGSLRLIVGHPNPAPRFRPS